MKTHLVTKPFTFSDAAGTRELVPYEADVAHCPIETAASMPPNPAPDPEQ